MIAQLEPLPRSALAEPLLPLDPRLVDYIQSNQQYVHTISQFGAHAQSSIDQHLSLEHTREQLKGYSLKPFSDKSLSIREESVRRQHFLFLDPRLPDSFYTAEQLAQSYSDQYTERRKSAWEAFYSTESEERREGYAALNEPDRGLCDSVIDMVCLTVEYMKNKAGSVNEYFKIFDEIDWHNIFENPVFNTLVKKHAILYESKICERLQTSHLKPEDLFAMYAMDMGNDIVPRDDSTSEDRIRLFLRHLGFEDLAQTLFIGRGVTSAANILFTSTSPYVQPAIYHSEAEGTIDNTYAHDKDMAHEAGHAIDFHRNNRITPFAWAGHPPLIEFSSMFFELLYECDEMLRLFKPENQESIKQQPLPLINVLMLTEFVYRLYNYAEKRPPTPAILGHIQADLNSKYFGVAYDSSRPIDHTWQYTSADRLIGEINYDGSYTVGSAWANLLYDRFKQYFGNEWIGSKRFKQEFPEMFQHIFPFGALTVLSDIEKGYRIKTEDLILHQLRKEII